MTTSTDVISVQIKCPFPECADRPSQPAQFDRYSMKQDLDVDKNIRVGGFYCDHIWSLSKQEKDNLRTAIAEGF